VPLTEAKIKVYSSLTHLILRIIFASVFLIAFIVVLGFLLYFCFNPGVPEIKIILGAIDAILAGTLYPTVKWLFPTK
jgi:hypothetical protein